MFCRAVDKLVLVNLRCEIKMSVRTGGRKLFWSWDSNDGQRNSPWWYLGVADPSHSTSPDLFSAVLGGRAMVYEFR